MLAQVQRRVHALVWRYPTARTATHVTCACAPLPSPAALMRVLAKYDDTRMRLWRYLKEWDWGPLIQCLRLQVLASAGVGAQRAAVLPQ